MPGGSGRRRGKRDAEPRSRLLPGSFRRRQRLDRGEDLVDVRRGDELVVLRLHDANDDGPRFADLLPADAPALLHALHLARAQPSAGPAEAPGAPPAR